MENPSGKANIPNETRRADFSVKYQEWRALSTHSRPLRAWSFSLYGVGMAGRGPILPHNWTESKMASESEAQPAEEPIYETHYGQGSAHEYSWHNAAFSQPWLAGLELASDYVTGRSHKVARQRQRDRLNINELGLRGSRIGNFAAGKPGCWNTKRGKQSSNVKLLAHHMTTQFTHTL